MQTVVAHEKGSSSSCSKTRPPRASKRGSWSSLRIDVEAGTDCTFVSRVVARAWIEHRKHRLDRRVALHGRNHEPLLEGGQRGEPENGLYLGPIGLAFGERFFHLLRRYILDLLRAHVDAHRDQLAINIADDLLIAARQQARHVAQRYARSFERAHQRP